MTREVAIKAIQDFIGWFKEDSLIRKALEMAIKALSQVSEIEENIIKYMKKYPNHVGNTDFWEGFYACRNVVLQLDDEEYAPKEQEPCDDAISREAAIKTVHKMRVVCDTEDIDDYYELLVESFKQLLSVTQKSGKWLIIDDCEKFIAKCSECGRIEDSRMIGKYPYCHCGAKMESEEV